MNDVQKMRKRTKTTKDTTKRRRERLANTITTINVRRTQRRDTQRHMPTDKTCTYEKRWNRQIKKIARIRRRQGTE